LQSLQAALRQLIESGWGNRKEAKAYVKVSRDLIDTMEDSVLRKTAEKMQEKAVVFDKLRQAMRIALPDGKDGLNDRGEDADIHTIEKAVEQFCDWISGDERMSNQDDYKQMVAQIKHYWKKLFSDPLVVDTLKGKLIIQPQRTNNVLEQLFRDIKRRYRKKSGTKVLSKVFKAMLGDTPLVKNLENQQYLNIILDGKASLEERFSEIDSLLVHKELSKLQNVSEKIPPKIKRIIRMQEFPDTLVALFAR